MKTPNRGWNTMSILNVKKGKPGETMPATSESQSMDKLKAALRDAKIDVDLDAVQAEYDEKMRRREEARQQADEAKKSRQEIEHLNQETAMDLLKRGNLILVVDKAQQTEIDVRCRCGESLKTVQDDLSSFGQMWRDTPDKEHLTTWPSIAGGFQTMPCFVMDARCPKCQATTHVFAQLVLVV